jgi:hypothetical protein
MAPTHPFFLLLLLLLLAFPGTADTGFNALTTQAYHQIMKLRIGQGRELIQTELKNDPENICALLVENYADFFTLMITQDPNRYQALMGAQEKRLERLIKLKVNSPYQRYSQAEIRLQMAIGKLFFDHQLEAAWDFRQAYLLYQENDRIYPGFLPNKKSFGLLQIMLGSAPESYRWVLGAVGMKGNISTGIADLQLAVTKPHPFQAEAQILYSLLQELIFNQDKAAQNQIARLAAAEPDNLLYSFLQISILKKFKQGEQALAFYHLRPEGKAYTPFYYLHHMAADLYLYKGDYERSVNENLIFLAGNQSRHYVKAAHFKLYTAYLLNHNFSKAQQHFDKIKTQGVAVTEEDKYAAKFFENQAVPDVVLLKARLSADGGYFKQSLQYLHLFELTDKTSLKDKTEYYYRKARACHGLGQTVCAIQFYKKTIAIAGQSPFYFAPNAALQLGYIYKETNDTQNARFYFKKALSYSRHEYKNSIDSKAKVALAAL